MVTTMVPFKIEPSVASKERREWDPESSPWEHHVSGTKDDTEPPRPTLNIK